MKSGPKSQWLYTGKKILVIDTEREKGLVAQKKGFGYTGKRYLVGYREKKDHSIQLYPLN